MKYVAGIDVGCTKILGALVAENGDVIEECKVPSDFDEGGFAILNKIYRIIDDIKESYRVDAVGIGIGGRIDTVNGRINWGVRAVPDYFGLEVKKLTEERYGVPCAVENDVKVAGYGEQWAGAARNASSYACITLGTGLGGAIRLNGDMLHGAHWSGGELGHIILHPNGRKCFCGFRGCAEKYLSGHALVEIYNELSKTKVETGYEYFEQVRRNEPVALQVLENFVDDLYNLLLTVYNGFDPEMVILGGGLIDTRAFWWDKLQSKLDNSPINQVFTPVLVPAELGNRAGYMGAAYLALELLK